MSEGAATVHHAGGIELMGVLTIEQIVSADGYVAAPDGDLSFFEAADFGDESRTDSEQMRWLQTVDASLLGANTYRAFAEFWPHADPATDAVAEPINRLPKFVVSNSLARAPWGQDEITVVRGDGADAARRLKDRFASICRVGQPHAGRRAARGRPGRRHPAPHRARAHRRRP